VRAPSISGPLAFSDPELMNVRERAGKIGITAEVFVGARDDEYEVGDEGGRCRTSLLA